MTDSPQARLRAFWDERYSAGQFVYGVEPNTFLFRHAAPLSAGDTVLCLADGEGRNGVWLATQGAAVTSTDISSAGLRKAEDLARGKGVGLQFEVGDVTELDLGSDRWNLVVSIFLHLPADRRRRLHQRVVKALKPGGRYLYEAYGAGQLALGTGGPKEAELLVNLDEVAADFAGDPSCAIVHRFQGVRAVHEGPLHQGDGEVVQLIVRKNAT